MNNVQDLGQLGCTDCAHQQTGYHGPTLGLVTKGQQDAMLKALQSQVSRLPLPKNLDPPRPLASFS